MRIPRNNFSRMESLNRVGMARCAVTVVERSVRRRLRLAETRGRPRLFRPFRAGRGSGCGFALLGPSVPLPG